jgi:hypothetical protein
MDDMPKVVLTVTVTLLVFVVGMFAFLVVNEEIGYTKSQTETFSVSDPSVDKTCTTVFYVDSVTSVQQYNGMEWVNVDAAYISFSGKQVVVDSGGMQG